MATITVKKIPDDLYERLREVAKLHHRSINSEIIVCIDQALRSDRLSPAETLSRARRLRSQTNTEPLTMSELIDAKSAGRP